MKRKWFPATWLALMTLGGVAQAQSGYQGTPRSSMVEFKLGSFVPRIDTEPGLTSAPYRDTFGPSGMLLAELEYDYQLFQAVGSAAVGFSIGYSEKYGNAIISSTGALSPEKTALFVVPMKLLAVYRFDYFAVTKGFPLVPYGKIGLIYMPWWITKGAGVEYVNGNRAAGAKWGYGFTGGLSFQLDVLEPRMARDFDSDMGVNHVYLFAEYQYQDVDNFGKPGLRLGSRYFMFGLSLEF